MKESFLFVLTTACLCLHANAGENQNGSDPLKEMRNACMEEGGLTYESLQLARHESSPDNRKAQCYVYCVIVRAGAFIEGVGLNVTAGVMAVPKCMQEYEQAALDECTRNVTLDDDPCEYSWKVSNCEDEFDPTAHSQLGLYEPPPPSPDC